MAVWLVCRVARARAAAREEGGRGASQASGVYKPMQRSQKKKEKKEEKEKAEKEKTQMQENHEKEISAIKAEFEKEKEGWEKERKEEKKAREKEREEAEEKLKEEVKKAFAAGEMSVLRVREEVLAQGQGFLCTARGSCRSTTRVGNIKRYKKCRCRSHVIICLSMHVNVCQCMSMFVHNM